MKKQILSFALTLALLAGTSVAFGQALPGSAPRGINCTDDALHPIAGKLYTYQAASNQGGDFTFWATKDFNFITTTAGTTTTNIATRLTTPTDLLTTSGNYATAATTDNVQITWSDAILAATTAAAPTFVAVNNEGTCTNNFKAWAIEPIIAFTVDIRNIDNAAPTVPLAFDATESQCFDEVNGATYSGGQILYNFGTQVLYFEVIAANFTGSWTPTFNLTGLGNGQTALLEWSYTNNFAAIVGSSAIVNGTAVTTVPVTTTATSTTLGVSIYVRVTITNATYEGIVATPIILAVDGVNSVSQWDIENNNAVSAGPLCLPGALNDKLDIATQTLNPRPTVTPVAPTPFVPGNQTN